jgi:hypothetical protein
MPQYPARGALFTNKNKAKNDRAPDYNGNLELDDETIDFIYAMKESGSFEGDYPKLEMSAWVKTSQSGRKWLSLSAKKPYNAETPKVKKDRDEPDLLDSDEIPF